MLSIAIVNYYRYNKIHIDYMIQYSCHYSHYGGAVVTILLFVASYCGMRANQVRTIKVQHHGEE
jgi:hypothetical protein